MSISRRDLLKVGASAAALTTLASLPRPLLAQLGGPPEPVPPIRDPRLRALAFRGVEAARAAGAAYADVRLSHTRTRRVSKPSITGISDSEAMVAGARALVNGYWGFASSPVWSPDEMARLGREAVHQAKANALGQVRVVELAPAPAIDDGHWVMPVEIDPFETSPLEIVDYLASLKAFVERVEHYTVLNNECEFHTQEKAFASSEGSYCTQRLYLSSGAFVVRLRDRQRRREAALPLDRLTPAGLGWELYRGQPLREYIRQLMAEIEEEATIPVKPIEVGRYDTVCDAATFAAFAGQTLGRATSLDVALGYEANAGGTSFLTEPLAMLGTLQVGAPSLTLMANRSERGGAATTKWDDEGVEPETFPLVKDGVLADFQTTRESARWLAEPYAKRGTPVRSHGCAAAPSALEAPLHHVPNLAVAPGAISLSRDAMLAGVKRGIDVRSMGAEMDFQASSGMGLGRVYDVKDGKRVARLNGAAMLFRATDLWKGLTALGGEASLRRYGHGASKGEPAQQTWHSITAPPAAFEQLTFVDIMRKA